MLETFAEAGSTANVQSIATSLGTEITAENLWAGVVPFAGILGALVVFSFCYRVFRKLISKAGKGKAGA